MFTKKVQEEREEGQLYAQRDSGLQPNSSQYGSTTALKSPQRMVGNVGLTKGGSDAKNSSPGRFLFGP